MTYILHTMDSFLVQQEDSNDIVMLVASTRSTDLSSITGAHTSYKNLDENEWDLSQWSSFTNSEMLYGRGKETLQLLKTYQTLLQTKQTQSVFVHGESGSGKTALVNMTREQICSTDGYFVTGKFEQNSAVQEPYSAIMAAFSDVCDLTAQSDDFDEVRKEQIRNDLGSDAHLLMKSITNLSPFIDDDLSEMPVEASFSKFKFACKSFLRAMVSERHPIVVFLDDIQWADEGSRLLIQMFVADSELKNIMFVLAYRDEDAALVVDVLSDAKDAVDIALFSLDSSAVHQIVTSILESNTNQIRDLSNVIGKRAAGNPFHVKMVVEAMIQHGHLRFDHDGQSWMFHIETLQSVIMVSETLADLLTRKIEQLPTEIIETLKVASLLGYHFRESILVNVMCTATEKQADSDRIRYNGHNVSQESVLASLLEAVEAGFIDMAANAYHFTHDRLQSSFQALIDEREEEHTHLRIGEAYLALAESDHDVAMYNAAVHLNQAPDSRCNRQQRAKLARINLGAAKYCEYKSAFANAVLMLKRGLEALDSQMRWSVEHFDLTFELTKCLAKTQLIIGDLEGCRVTTAEASRHASTVGTKLNMLMIDAEASAARMDFNGGIMATYRALAILGVKMPRKVSMRHVILKYLKVKVMLRGKSDAALLRLPLTEDHSGKMTVKLLMYLLGCSNSAGRKELAIFSGLLAMDLTLKRGLSPQSPFAFAVYGVCETFLGSSESGYRFGRIALALLNKVDDQEAACPTVGIVMSSLLWWKESLQELVDPLFQVGKVGLRRGDMIYGPFCLSQSFATQLIIGTNLETLESSMRETYSMLFDMGNDGLLLWYQPYLQYILKMRSSACRWDCIGTLSGEIMDEVIYFQEVADGSNPVLKKIALRMKLQEAVYFNHFELAVSILNALELSGGNGNKAAGFPNVCWLAARACLEHYQTTSQRRHLRKGRKYIKKLKQFEASGCPNAAPYLSFLNVEQISRRKKIEESELLAAYNKGIACMAQNGFVHLEGLLNERAGFDFIIRERLVHSDYYFQRAMHLFQNEWGSIAKGIWLGESSRAAFNSLPEHVIESAHRNQLISFVPR